MIGEDFFDIIDNVTQIFRPNVELKVYPNPVSEYAIFELENVEDSDFTFKLFDAVGRLQVVDDFSGNAYRFYRKKLKSSLYYFQIEEAGKLLVTGKLVLK
ncbi:MAG: hypothetical protein ACI9XO_004507 [Paraglaciecola sp.]